MAGYVLDVHVDGTRLDRDRVIDAVRFSRVVAEMNGNQKQMTQVLLVTTNYDDIVRELPHSAKKYDAEKLKNLYGMTWRQGSYSYIWLNSERKGAMELDVDRDIKKTLIHELAHARCHGAVSHGWTWRSMYSRLLPVCAEILDFPMNDDILRREIINTIYRYQRVGLTSRPARFDLAGPITRRYEEADKHVAATLRLMRRLTDDAGRLKYSLIGLP
jgi:hypothetical protein